MGWEFSTAQRIRMGAALVVVFLLILATNLIDSHHFSIVQKSLTSIYEDRLLAKNYLYHISRQVQLKQELLQSDELEDKVELNQTANDSIKSLISKYQKTRLTEAEARHFTSLQNDLSKLFQYEENYAEGESIDRELPTVDNTEGYYSSIFEDLDALSQIQVGEGKREIDLSNKSIRTSNLISKIEIGALILIGLILQLLIFIRPVK